MWEIRDWERLGSHISEEPRTMTLPSKTEAQRGEVIDLTLCSSEVAELYLKPGLLSSFKAQTLEAV